MNSERRGLIFDKRQLESLTNGVFAIIMTILIFNISVPELILFAEGKYASERLLSILADLLPDISAYIVSFVTLGVYWVTYHRIFRWVLYADRVLIWINISFLMTIGLIPFSTALLTQYMNEQLSIFVYAFNSILAGLIIFALYHHAKNSPELVDKTVHILIMKSSGRRLELTLLSYLIAIIFAFIYLPISHLFFLLVLLPEFIPDRFLAREKG